MPDINKAKFALMEMDGVLSYEYDTESFASVGGLQGLKDWLGETGRKRFHGQNGNRQPPRHYAGGACRAGGKSLAAKGGGRVVGVCRCCAWTWAPSTTSFFGEFRA